MHEYHQRSPDPGESISTCANRLNKRGWRLVSTYHFPNDDPMLLFERPTEMADAAPAPQETVYTATQYDTLEGTPVERLREFLSRVDKDAPLVIEAMENPMPDLGGVYLSNEPRYTFYLKVGPDSFKVN